MKVYLGKEVPFFGLKELTNLPKFELPLTDFLDNTFICGASGSGKTVLTKAIIEDFTQSGIPAIIIDTQGYMDSLGLVFPSYQPESFISWLPETADLKTLAAQYAKRYLHRLKLFEISRTAISTLFDKIRVTIFTPRADQGVRMAIPTLPAAPLNIDEFLQKDPDLLLTLATTIALGLIERLYPQEKLELKERETNFLTQLILYAWKKKIRLEGMEGLKRLGELIETPPVKMIGIIPMDRFILNHKRKDLALRLNAMLVRDEQSWYMGLPLEMETLLGENVAPPKTPISVIDLSHITSFEEQSFILSQALSKIYFWLKQAGPANKPRLLLCVDDLRFNANQTFFPRHNGMTAAKYMLNHILAIAPAYGAAVVLSATTPGNLDYKSLSECKTWAIGCQSNEREWVNLSAGLTDINTSVEQLARDNNQAQAGEFILKLKNGETKFIHQRWITSFHQRLTPEQIRRYTAEQAYPQTTSFTKEIVEDRETLIYKEEGLPASFLEIISGEFAGKKVILTNGEAAYGRGEFCPHNARVSRRHFKIIYKDGEHYIKDNSTNGTFIAGRKIDVRRLEPNDEIVLGKAEVMLKYVKVKKS